MYVWLLNNKKLVAVALAFLLLVGFTIYSFATINSLNNKVSSLETSLEKAEEKVDFLDKSYTDLVKQTDKMQVDLNRYFTLAQLGEQKYQNALNTLANLRERENQASTDPVSLSRDIRAEDEEYRKELACAVGNLEYCSQ